MAQISDHESYFSLLAFFSPSGNHDPTELDDRRWHLLLLTVVLFICQLWHSQTHSEWLLDLSVVHRKLGFRRQQHKQF